MPQHDFAIANQSFPAIRSDINGAIEALATCSSGSSAPSTTYPNQLWADTLNGLLKQRNTANTAWTTLFPLSEQGLLTQACSSVYAMDSGSTDTYTANLSPAPTGYTAGQLVLLKANTINTGAATLNLNGLGAKAILKYGNQPLTDGDIKAGQVVPLVYDGTNFNLISPVVETGPLFLAGPAPVYTNASTITIKAGTIAADDTGRRIMKRTADLTLSLASSGAGGLDTGTEASNTWYYVWLCEGTSGVTAVFSASRTSPSLPTGFTSFKRLLPFAVRNDASGNLIPFGNIIGWTGGQPFVPWDVARAFYQDGTGYTGGTARVIAAGTATSWTDVSCAAFVPPISRRAGIRLAKDGTTYNGFRPNGATHTGIGSHTVNGNDLFDVDLDASQIFEYIRWPAGGGNIHADVTGFYVTEV